MQCGHLDGEGEEVVNEGVEEFVGHGAGGHVCDGLRSGVSIPSSRRNEKVLVVES